MTGLSKFIVIGGVVAIVTLAGTAYVRTLEFSCAQVQWAVATFGRATVESMAVKYGATKADESRALKCLAKPAPKAVEPATKQPEPEVATVGPPAVAAPAVPHKHHHRKDQPWANVSKPKYVTPSRQ